MTPLQLEPSAQAPWTSTIFGRVFISVVPSRSGLTAILRSETEAGYPQHYCTLRMPVAYACCGCLLRGRRGDTAGLAGRERKEPYDFGLDRDTQLAVACQLAIACQLTAVIQQPPTTPDWPTGPGC